MIPSGVQIRKSFDVSVIVKYSYHFAGGLLVEQQWHVNQNKIVSGFLRATFHLTISMRGQRATGKIQRNNYHHGSWGPSLTDKRLRCL